MERARADQPRTSTRPPAHGKSCKRMANVGFEDMAEDDADLRAAWRDRLQREGKLNPEGGSLADLILGPAERR